jgi:hypothetical protein
MNTPACRTRLLTLLMLYLLGLLAALPTRAQQLDWVRNLALDAASWTQPDAMTMDASGGYVTGALYNRTTSRSYIRKYDFLGRLAWTHVSDTGPGVNEYFRDVATDGTGVYAAGSAGTKALVLARPAIKSRVAARLPRRRRTRPKPR